ncbi:coagulation factor IX-like [Oncorhynchus mykiss]|uniref:coagulation factor IX-like n=1 Tax=Oncorhynchus mykiss TaxID=8022 RepID=UPI001878F524|nr:coagulation factor IX-like [Oncorhynchus mykiss]
MAGAELEDGIKYIHGFNVFDAIPPPPPPHRSSTSSNRHFSSVLEDLPSWAFFPTQPTIQEESSSGQRIVGGNTGSPGEIPWQVSLMSKLTGQNFCDGSLLSDLWVITAAHCLSEGKIGSFIRVGEHKMQVREETELLLSITCTRDTTSLYNHDIALLKLHTPAVLSNYSLPICLGPKAEILLREASKWGRMHFQDPEASFFF